MTSENNNSVNNGDYVQLSDRQLRFGYWYLTHKKRFKKYFIYFLIVLNFVLFGYSVYKWLDLFVFDYDRHLEQIANASRNYVDYKMKPPRNFQILGVAALSAGEQKYDLIAQVRNPNPDWVAFFRYRFFTGDNKVETKEYKDFLSPANEKYLMDLGVSSERSLSSPRLQILSVQWKRFNGMDLRKHLDALGIDKDNFDVQADKINFTSSRSLGLGQKLNISRLTFKAVNNTVFNFWQAPFSIVLFSGTRPVGVSYVRLKDFDSGQSKQVEVNWFHKLPSVTKVLVNHDINLVDFSNYKSFEGKPLSPDVRDIGKFRR